MKIMIVDDSVPRVELIKNALSTSGYEKFLEVAYCDSADQGREGLTDLFDLLILDILIPKKNGGVAQALHSVNLLADICNPKKHYIRPRLIIGLTADLAELNVYQQQFSQYASIVLEGSLKKIDWLDSLLEQVGSLVGTERKITQQQRDMALISVHGIRTYGKWQERLSHEVSQYSRRFDFIEVKYGFLDLFSFSVPFLRKKVVEKVAARLIHNLHDHEDKSIYIVAHSFGTLIVADALRRYTPSRLFGGIVFCGSPLQHDADIDHVVRSSTITLNECGIHDFVLILARLLFLGLGDAGRIGFSRENSKLFINRYFRGGHGLYFGKIKNTSTFYDRFWLKLIALGEAPERVDNRRNYAGQDFIDLSIKVVTFLKPLMYLAVAGCTGRDQI